MAENSKDKSINISPVPKCVNNFINNCLEKPGQAIGTTFADIWFLAFGGISQYADKRKLKYQIELEKFKHEIEAEIDAIPKHNKVEADTQFIGLALDASKYCVEKEELRCLFSSLIASSMNKEKEKYVHPLFIDIIKRMSVLEAKVFKVITLLDDKIEINTTENGLSASLEILTNMGLIVKAVRDNKWAEIVEERVNKGQKTNIESSLRYIVSTLALHTRNGVDGELPKEINMILYYTYGLTALGLNLAKACFSKTEINEMYQRWEQVSLDRTVAAHIDIQEGKY